MERSLVRDDFKGRLKDHGGSNGQSKLQEFTASNGEIIKYYWSIKYNGRVT